MLILRLFSRLFCIVNSSENRLKFTLHYMGEIFII